MPEDECPFEAGREDRTPPETLRIGDDPWQVRVFPNLYPAFERPRGRRPHAEARRLARRPRRRAAVARRGGVAAAREAEPAGYLHALVNEGREAGASREHTHSQLVWLGDPPPPETQHGVERERWSVVAERDGLVSACPYVSRLPYELVIAPADPRGNAFGDDLLPRAVVLLGEAVRRLQAVQDGAVPLNAWLHASDDWHIEVLPRTATLAGIELGARIYVNSVSPEDAAEMRCRRVWLAGEPSPSTLTSCVSPPRSSR